MGGHLVRQLVVDLSAAKQREEASDERPHFSAFDNVKNFVTILSARCQTTSSVPSCRSPPRVIE
jgi:hypothetical protein